MVTTYGSFPGVRVNVAGGGITAVAIGAEEKLVIFGEAQYENDINFSAGDGNQDPTVGDASPENPTQINARREADTFFGEGSELANAMRESLANGANIDFLYGVAPQRWNVVGEVQSTQSGTLSNAPIWEEDVSDESNINALRVVDDADATRNLEVRYSYDNDLVAPDDAPTDSTADADIVVVNPLTGEYIADQTPTGDLVFDYKYLDWQSALNAQPVTQVVNEDETGIYDLLTDSDLVSVDAEGAASTRRNAYQLVNVISGAEPNDNELIEDSSGNYVRRDARFNASGFTKGSVDSDHYFKLAPVRKADTPETVLGAVGGLFAGNPLNDPIYNDPISVSGDLEQSLTKADADDLRDDEVIPIRQAGSIRVKDNLSTSTATDWERDFWRRRITDRVILIGKTIGDTIIGRINDPDTRDAAARLIRAELRELVDDRLLRPNTSEEQRWFVDVYVDSGDPDQVNIDIGFTPYGIVKRVEETVTINT